MKTLVVIVLPFWWKFLLFVTLFLIVYVLVIQILKRGKKWQQEEYKRLIEDIPGKYWFQRHSLWLRAYSVKFIREEGIATSKGYYIIKIKPNWINPILYVLLAITFALYALVNLLSTFFDKDFLNQITPEELVILKKLK